MRKFLIALSILTASLTSAAYAGENWIAEDVAGAARGPSISVQQNGEYVKSVDVSRFKQAPADAAPHLGQLLQHRSKTQNQESVMEMRRGAMPKDSSD